MIASIIVVTSSDTQEQDLTQIKPEPAAYQQEWC